MKTIINLEHVEDILNYHLFDNTKENGQIRNVDRDMIYQATTEDDARYCQSKDKPKTDVPLIPRCQNHSRKVDNSIEESSPI